MKVSLFILCTLGLVLSVDAAAQRGGDKRGGPGRGGPGRGRGRGGLKGPFKVCKGHILTTIWGEDFGQKMKVPKIFHVVHTAQSSK